MMRSRRVRSSMRCSTMGISGSSFSGVLGFWVMVVDGVWGFCRLRRIVKPSATPFQNALHKVSSTANTCAGCCSICARISQCIHQNIGQCPDASGKIPVANRWCFRLSRAARAGTAAESKILRPALLLPPRAARTLCPCPA